MKRRIIIAVSLSANVVLAAFWWHGREAGVAATPAAVVNSPQATSLGLIRPTATLEQTWDRLTDGADDAEFVARLRLDGFPPRMVRLLLMLRLRDRFAAELRELSAQETQVPYWRDRFGVASDSFELRAKRRVLDRRLAELARGALGPEPDRLPGHPQFADQQRRYGNIPADKINGLEAIQRDYNDLAREIRDAAGGITLPEDREKLAYLDREKRVDITSLLTPEELVQYDLRNNPSAVSVRHQLRYFEPSEQEFLALHRLQRGFDERYGRDHLSAEQQARRRAAEPALLAEIEAALGAGRFAEYQVFADGSFSRNRDFASTAGLPADIARPLVTLQRDANRRADALRADPSLPPEQQAAQLQALQNAAAEQIRQIVGADNLESYKRGPGGWLERLVRPSSGPSG